MYGSYKEINHFSSFDGVQSLPRLLSQSDSHWNGIIGKKHVGPSKVYPFQFSYTELDGYDLNLVGRNITFMNEKMQEFLKLAQEQEKPFFLCMAFYDAHRCKGDLGEFCNLYGDRGEGHGTIPNWVPFIYDPGSIDVPFYVQDNFAARADIAAQYSAVNRMDQGIGYFMQSLEHYGFDDSTLVIFTADNGSPFPGAKTNLYAPGMDVPMIVSNPRQKGRWGMETYGMASSVDIFPTVLDWFNIDYPEYSLNGMKVEYRGKSLLSATEAEPSPRNPNFEMVYSSHSFHGISMNYPMRVMQEMEFKLIHNLNFKMPYPVASDVFLSPTFQDILKNTKNNVSTKWFKPLPDYYYRREWEFYDTNNDPYELHNKIEDQSLLPIINSMKSFLIEWQNSTNDPWLCLPGGELCTNRTCSSLLNGL